MAKTISADSASRPMTVLGQWIPEGAEPAEGVEAVAAALQDIRSPIFALAGDSGLAVSGNGRAVLGDSNLDEGRPLVGFASPYLPEHLGDPSFCADHGLRYAYVAGAMANGIGSEEIVEAMSRAGMLGFYGAAGLPLERVEQAVERLSANLADGPFGINLIHSPNESALEMELVELFLRREVRLIEASAFLKLTPAVVRYRVSGLHRDESGAVVAPNGIVAKLSREELAEKFFSPPPEKILNKLLDGGHITSDEASLATEIPMAQDVTAEADSGGHTDHRPALSLLPTLVSLKNRMQSKFGYAQRLRVGLGGGISTPESAAAAFAMGAAYVVTGSVNQACVEAGTSETVRKMLSETRQADVTRAPAADMFEMGVTVQVLKRGTMFAMRGKKLYELYRSCGSIEEIPAAEREKLEKTVFRASLDDIWEQTRAFFEERDARQVERAERDPKHKMALVFRWYLGHASTWANRGEAGREMDYQIWCGPAMGAFNEWVKGSFLDDYARRDVVTVALNILHGAALVQRVNMLHAQGVLVPAEALKIRPAARETLEAQLCAAAG